MKSIKGVRVCPQYLCHAVQLFPVCALIFLACSIANAQSAPVLIVNPNTTRAVALLSITHRKEPFPLTSPMRFGSDGLTRILVFATRVQLKAGETVSAITADVQDASGRVFTFRG